MKLNSILSFNNSIYPFNSSLSDNKVSFEGKTPKKIIERIMSSECVYSKNLKFTFEDAVKVYGYLGYDVLTKRGSHAIVPTPLGNLPLIIPHKDKYINPKDVVRLRFMIEGEIQKALNF